ncbi:MAG: hypothetical protein HY985_10750 [Magnetospirillum sp.]|nr:hypothetical protein [Magnetospirillum sp.]
MSSLILPVGAFVWCRFPLREAHREPGPKDHLHLVYVQDTADTRAVSIYTTSVTWPSDKPLPFGVIAVPTKQAAELGQKSFVLDARRIGVLPMTPTWFPDINKLDHGILKVAPASFQREVARIAHEVARRKELIEWYGPGAPGLTKREVARIAHEVARRKELIEWYGPGAPGLTKATKVDF